MLRDWLESVTLNEVLRVTVVVVLWSAGNAQVPAPGTRRLHPAPHGPVGVSIPCSVTLDNLPNFKLLDFFSLGNTVNSQQIKKNSNRPPQQINLSPISITLFGSQTITYNDMLTP